MALALDTRAVERELERLARLTPGAVETIAVQGAEGIKAASQQRAPIRTGDLRRSEVVFTEATAGQVTTVGVAVTVDYAADQETQEHYTHPMGGEAHYHQRAFDEDGPLILRALAAELLRELGGTMTLAAGLRAGILALGIGEGVTWYLTEFPPADAAFPCGCLRLGGGRPHAVLPDVYYPVRLEVAMFAPSLATAWETAEAVSAALQVYKPAGGDKHRWTLDGGWVATDTWAESPRPDWPSAYYQHGHTRVSAVVVSVLLRVIKETSDV